MASKCSVLSDGRCVDWVHDKEIKINIMEEKKYTEEEVKQLIISALEIQKYKDYSFVGNLTVGIPITEEIKLQILDWLAEFGEEDYKDIIEQLFEEV